MHLPHSTYYRDRDTEYDLCQDFPADEALLKWLSRVQTKDPQLLVKRDVITIRK